ncbi:hypothetical protein POX_a01614 [Penicillium oxalicum]|uniref:Uncharacterized protein n=1 Tax=Penicillium oxalicum (strain 114-2 / CGMCC 5302) TaxID=933388 RepID=S7ZSM6_PENO1|nr:hypothetical protein POX_a01614 [Penicillium oxalicum]EPS33399.1 hypothetical protein PDE_08361 [Penicillium oxalicum 114-2]KAI2795011.1 hypothetical protein POX_a01614 [Penicillium oxalicum]
MPIWGWRLMQGLPAWLVAGGGVHGISSTLAIVTVKPVPRPIAKVQTNLKL